MSLKVLHLIDSGGLYGAEKMLLALVKEQIKHGLQPMILSAGEPGIEEKTIEAEAKRLGLPVTPWRMKAGLNIKGMREILSWARSAGFELFHSHGYKFNILLAVLPSRQIGVPLVTTLHGYLHARRFSKMWVYETMDRWAIKRFDKVVLVSGSMRMEVGGNSEPNMLVIPNGLNSEAIRRAAGVPLADELERFRFCHTPLIIGVGRLSREKGFDCLVDAFALFRRAYPHAGLLIVGEGRERIELDKQISARGLNSSILLPGYVRNVPACIKAADILAMPSRNEGLPITLLEGMAVGSTIVASAVGAIPQTLGHGRGGFIVYNDAPEELATALKKAWWHERHGRAKACWARARVDAKHSVENMSQRYLEVYDAAIAARYYQAL